MSINNIVSVNNVLINLMDDLDLVHTKYKPMFVNWAIAAEKKIGGIGSYKRRWKVLDITNCCVELPCEANVLEIAVLGDYGCECQDLFRRCYDSLPASAWDNSSGFLVIDRPSFEQAYGFIDYQVQDNTLVFNRSLAGEKITIQYQGISLDKDGIPMVGENHLEAIAEYCMYKFHRRTVKNSNDIALYRDAKREFESLAACARGDDAVPTDSQQQRIANMLHNPLAGRGLWLEPLYNNGWQT